jgi:hypothetical protein
MVRAMSDETREASDETTSREQSRKMARRYFVKAAIYAAPVVAGVVAVNHASASVSSCNLQGCVSGTPACNPADPNFDPACATCIGTTCP